MATITPTVDNPQGIDANIVWETLTENDTAAEAYWPGGRGFIEVRGTFGGATCTLHYGMTTGVLAEVDADEAPDGGSFTSQGIALFDLPEGYVKPVASGGTSQDLDIEIKPAPVER